MSVIHYKNIFEGKIVGFHKPSLKDGYQDDIFELQERIISQ